MRRFNLPCLLRLASAIVLVLSLVALSGAVRAATAVVRDGDTIQLGDVTYRLDGADAPELDQVCIDDHADPFACGLDAREQLTKLIGGRTVHCDDLGPDKAFRSRHLGICRVDGDTESLNRQLVQKGLAVSVEPAAKLHLKDDAAAAKAANLGLWKGCFAAPQDFRTGKKDGALAGASCRADREAEIRAVLFPADLSMPPNCSIKGKFAVRARFTGNVGIYHLQGCLSYAGTQPDRWFCSEDDAKAAGFRRAFNCRAGKSK
ncbi:MAG TPA: thermonuclease family protein [Bradyrhizobium sp.]|nr:thermonuclease family protein [Bradyrhizobium sp.]